MLSGWLVGTSGEGSCFLGEGPWGAATGHGGSSNSETIQQVGCWMGDSPYLGLEVSPSIADLGDKLLPARAIEVELGGLLDELVELIEGGLHLVAPTLPTWGAG
jgi:hypothetical protein